MANFFRSYLEERYKGSVIPPWLLNFNEDPEAALHDLLRGIAPLGHLSGSDPDELLLDWLQGFGLNSPYARMLDSALTHWIDHHWGEILLPGTIEDATVTSQAWLWAIDTIVASPLVAQQDGTTPQHYPLFGASKLLRERMLADRRFLNDMTEGRTHDPQGRAWIAIANHQVDQTLLNEWWRLVSLPPDEPWYRGEYGLIGLRHLPLENPGLRGGFNKKLAEGLGRLGEAFWKRAKEGWLLEDMASSEFASLVNLAMRWSTFPDRWRNYWRHLARRHQDDEGFIAWLPIPGSDLHQSEHARSRWVEPDPAWARRAKALAGALVQPTKETVVQAEKLLAEQRYYANATGNMSFFVRTVGGFSAGIRAANPQQALIWAQMAKTVDPWDTYAWNNEAMALLAMRKHAKALGKYNEAILRFPHNVFTRTGRAEVLKLKGALDEALGAYDETIKLFSNDVVARTGRKGVLWALQKQGQTITTNQKEAAPPKEKNQCYEVDCSKTGQDVAIDFGKNQVLVTDSMTKILDEKPYIVSRGESALNREEITLLITDAYLIRRWAKEEKEDDPWINTGIQRNRVRTLLEALWEESTRDPLAAGESGILSLVTGDPEDRQRALSLLRMAIKRFPGSPRVRYALARAEREEAIATEDTSIITARQWQKLVRLDRHLFPIQWLGPLPLVAHFSKSDQELQKNANQLAIWLFPKFQAKDTETSFYTWWGSSVYSLLFGATVKDPSELPDIENVRRNIRINYRELVTKEEELIYRYAHR
uniref:Tetratricopeptide repeat-containing protein n=1 Tax=Candidatus Kentrum sp. TUN TaxID=2126343 RepID=A0A451A357_9GAMM|nr:MAG: Tetratricopeptide repeat-containing protein [Candidatus Kentron sp. TUN]